MAEPTLEAQVASLTDATTALLNAVNVSKSTLDSSKNTAVSSAAAAAASESAAELAKAAAESAATSAEAASGFTTQDNVADTTSGRIVLVDYNADPLFDRICKIAGMAPTLYLNAKEQDYRIYSPSTGLTRKALTDIVTTTRASDGAIFDAKGQLTQLTDDAPRVTFDPETGVGEGLLVEESRTNLLTYSEQFDNAAWTKYEASISPNAAVAPDGTLTADKIVEDNSNNAHYAEQTLTVVAGSSYVFFVYAKALERQFIQLYFDSASGGTALAGFDLGSGTTLKNSFVVSSNIELINNGYYRCSCVVIPDATTLRTQVRTNDKLSSTTGIYTGDGTSGLYIWGAQLEEGSFPTSYIPTTTAAATRAADVIKIDGTAFSDFYRQDALSVVCRGSTGDAGTFNMLVGADDGTSDNRLYLRRNRDIDRAIFTLVNAGSAIAITSNGDFEDYETHTVAFGVGDGSASISTDGASVASDVVESPSPNRFMIGSGINSNTQSGTTEFLAVFTKRLPNATLQQLSALVI